MFRKLLLTAPIVLLAAAANAQTPDWATQVAPILYNHCTACHHDNGIAPFSLLTYDEAVLNAGNIRADVSIHKMPPWPPDASYAHLAHERILSTAEINTIVNWVNGGTPQGTPSLAPPMPTYSTHGMINGTPDLKVKIPVYTSTAGANDVYQCFVIPSGLLADRYISSFEAVPGNPQCVHHVLVFADTTGICAHLQATSTSGPGYPDFGGVGSSSATMLGVWVPGSNPMSYPANFGLKIPAHADIVVQVHYPQGTAGMVDSTEVHFYFTPTTPREVFMQPILYHGDTATGGGDMLNGPLFIPADSIKTFYEEFPGILVSQNMTLLGAFPHMHLIGKTIESYAVHPAGDTDKFVKIDNWDFHWQGFYMFQKLRKVPAGTSLYAKATYDNTSANPNNPHSPPQNVTVGESTTNEMMIVFFVYTGYQAGDENIIADSTVLAVPMSQFKAYYHGQQLLDVFPNPTANDLIVKCYFEDPDVGSIDLVDMSGRVVKQYMDNGKLNAGYNAYSYSVSGVPPGTYNLVLKTSQKILSQKVVVIH